MDTSTINREVYVPPNLDHMTSDAIKWYLTGVANADKDLSTFKDLAQKLSQGEEDIAPMYRTELRALLAQALKANDDTQKLFPQLKSLVKNLTHWTEDSPISLFSQMKLKATIWFMYGKRDNKSYYLQNGAGLWCKKRVEIINPISLTNITAQNIEADLKACEKQLLYARDELDDAAQIYVQGIAKLVHIVDDVCKNEEEIRNVVQELEENGNKKGANILKTAQDSVDLIKAILNEI